MYETANCFLLLRFISCHKVRGPKDVRSITKWLIIFRYSVMLACWKTKPKDRPTFLELHKMLDDLLETSSPQKYLNLNLPIYKSEFKAFPKGKQHSRWDRMSMVPPSWQQWHYLGGVQLVAPATGFAEACLLLCHCFAENSSTKSVKWIMMFDNFAENRMRAIECHILHTFLLPIQPSSWRLG
jgi:hypothetical protein